MKNEKGFTLIELLAIIIILAVIAVITVPIILGIIDEAKKKAVISSAYGYKEAVNKYYAQTIMGNENLKLNGTYEIGENGKLGDMNIAFSGTVPTGGYFTYENNVLKNGCLLFDDNQVIFENGEVKSTGKGNCVPESISFAADSWSTIKANLSVNRNAYELGDEKEIEIDGISYTVRLANKTSCPSNWPIDASQTTCGVVIEFVDTIIDTENNIDGHEMNSTNTSVGGWPASSMYTYLNTTIFNKLPADLKGMIIGTKAVSGRDNQSGTSYTTENDKLYLLTTAEVFENCNFYDSVKYVSGNVTKGTKQLEYYGTQNSTVIKTTTEGISKTWWLRSAFSHYAGIFLNVTPTGEVGNSNASDKHGVAPAFRILN